MGEQREVWLIWASQGEYSDRTEWPVMVTMEEAIAQDLTVRLTALWHSIDARWRKIEPDWHDQQRLDKFWATDPEAVEYTSITGNAGEMLSTCYSDDRSYTCCAVPVWPLASRLPPLPYR